jgi:hypothetical protein
LQIDSVAGLRQTSRRLGELMRDHRSIRMILVLLLAGLGFSLACNAPVYLASRDAPPPPVGSPIPSPTVTLSAPSPAATRDSVATLAPLPTFTPIGAIATPGSVGTPADEPEPTRTVAATTAPTAATPLSFDYTISWTLDPNDGAHAIATVRIIVTGGTDPYAYYHDDLPEAGPLFTYRWAVCRANPGSLRVDAGTESMRIDYYELPPCPNP